MRSFGFRGEALSSLCGLSAHVAVTTATAAEAPMGTVLEIDARGRVASKSGKAARQVRTVPSRPPRPFLGSRRDDDA